MLARDCLKAPMPWYGGKSLAAALIWERLGNVPNYCEPFAGSLAVLLNRPHAPRIETVNDKDGFLCNVWRALANDPEQVAHYADWPCNESDLHARHVWLKDRRAVLTSQLEGDPDYYDTKIAGWWLWGISLWIGAGWCSTTEGGPWQVVEGRLVRRESTDAGIHHKRPHLMTNGKGVSRRLVHLGNAGQGVSRQRVQLGGSMGVHAQHAHGDGLLAWFQALQARLRHVRVCCGDWSRVMGHSVLDTHGLTGSYEGQMDMPASWDCVVWKPNGGYGNQSAGRGRENKHRERLWFNKSCLPPEQPRLF